MQIYTLKSIPDVQKNVTTAQKIPAYSYCKILSLPILCAAIYGITAYLGATVLDQTGHHNYDPIEALISGAIGGVIITGSIILLRTLCNIFRVSNTEDSDSDSDSEHDNHNKSRASLIASLISAIAGWAILNSSGYNTKMTLATISAASAIGYLFLCPLCCCCFCFPQVHVHKQERNTDARLNIAYLPSPLPPSFISHNQLTKGNNPHPERSAEMTATQAITLQV